MFTKVYVLFTVFIMFIDFVGILALLVSVEPKSFLHGAAGVGEKSVVTCWWQASCMAGSVARSSPPFGQEWCGCCERCYCYRHEHCLAPREARSAGPTAGLAVSGTADAVLGDAQPWHSPAAAGCAGGYTGSETAETLVCGRRCTCGSGGRAGSKHRTEGINQL
jgi:hypothetical protein